MCVMSWLRPKFRSFLVWSCFVVVLHGDLVGPAKEVQDEDVGDVQLGKVPAVVCKLN
jgi:hypothetical protein